MVSEDTYVQAYFFFVARLIKFLLKTRHFKNVAVLKIMFSLLSMFCLFSDFSKLTWYGLYCLSRVATEVPDRLAYWSVCDGTELSLNAWTQQFSSLCRGALGVLEHSVNPQPGSLQPQPAPPAWAEPQVSQSWELRAFSVFPRQAHSPGHAHSLLDSQEYVGASQSRCGRLIPQLFGLSFLVRLLFALSVIHPFRQLKF